MFETPVHAWVYASLSKAHETVAGPSGLFYRTMRRPVRAGLARKKERTTTITDGSLSGQFAIGGDLAVNRLAFGAMRITGPGIWGMAEDVDEARRVLRRLPDLGTDFIATADSYGPY